MNRISCFALLALGFWLPLEASAAPTQNIPATAIAYKNGELWGVLDPRGRVLIPPQFDELFIDDGGTVHAKKGATDYYYDVNGNVISNDDRAKELDFDTDGLAVATENEKAGLKDKSGVYVVQPQFGYINRFGPSMQYVAYYNGGVGVIDLATKQWVVPNNFQYIDKLSNNGLAIAKLKGQNGFIDRDGKWILRPGLFEALGAFDEFGLAVARRDGKCGFINDKFEWIIPPISEEDYCFFGFDQAGLFRTKQSGKIGLLNRQGTIVLAPEFDEIGWLSAGYYKARLGDKWGYIDRTGKISISPRFDAAGLFDKKLMATVSLGGKDFIINPTGKILWGGKFEALGQFDNDDWVPAKSRCKWGTADREGGWVIPPKYDCITYCYSDPPPMVSVKTGKRLYFRPDVE